MEDVDENEVSHDLQTMQAVLDGHIEDNSIPEVKSQLIEAKKSLREAVDFLYRNKLNLKK